MDIERKTIIDQIEIGRLRVIGVRFALLLIEDGIETDCKWHRTAIEPGGDVEATIAAVNANLADMKRPAVETDRITELKAIAGLVHTPDAIAAFRAEQAARAEQMADGAKIAAAVQNYRAEKSAREAKRSAAPNR